MVLASWVALLLGGLLAGVGPVAAMVWPRGREPLAVAGSLIAAAFAAAGLVGISILAHRADEAVVAGFLGVASALGGFALGGALLAQASPEPASAELPSPLPAASDGAAIVLLVEAEPSEYRTSTVAAELRELSEAGVQLPAETMRPFVYASEKARYRTLGRSPSRDTAREVAAKLGEAVEGRFPGGVTIAWCDDAPRLDEAIATVAARGSRRILVPVLAVADDAATGRARRRADAMRARTHGVEIAYCEPLWSSRLLAERVADRVLEAAGSPEGVGVALLGHGQPPELEDLDPVRTEQETYFEQRLRALLLERGFDEGNVRTGWAEWQEPGVTEVVRHLAALGCRRILVVPAVMPFESRITLLDVPDAVAQARVEATAEVTVLPAWGDDPVVVAALAERLDETAEEYAN